MRKIGRTDNFLVRQDRTKFFYKKWAFFVAAEENKNFGNTRPPKSSMDILFQSVISKNQSFFVKPYALSRNSPETPLKSATLWGPCCLKQHLLFLLPKIVDFIKTWKKSEPQMNIELWSCGKATFVADMLPQRPPINILPNCNIT